MAQGLFAARANGLDVKIDSAGTSDGHEGAPPDPRAQAICAQHDVDISGQRARQICKKDFEQFDLILVMDRNNFADVKAMKPKGSKAKIGMFLDYASGLNVEEVPDPYYDRNEGFNKVLQMIEKAADGLVKNLSAKT